MSRRAASGAALVLDQAEAELQANISTLVVRLRLLKYHVPRSERCEPGFPDWVYVGPGGVLFRELKKQKGTARPDQEKWLAALTLAGADAGIWRPSDWLSGRVARELQAIARRPR